MENKIYDLLIIGGGPGGTSGAVYAARKQLKTIMVTEDWGGQSIVSEKIENWIGTPAISGNDLALSFKNHVYANKGEFLELVEGKRVEAVEKDGENFVSTLTDGSKIISKTILVTAGSSRRKLEALNADKFEHKGVTYCASCDGPIFADQDVVVVGGGNAGFETAAQLLAYCKSVTLLSRNDFKADEITVKKVLANPKMKAMTFTIPTEIIGEKFVTGLKAQNSQTGEIIEIPTNGVFVEVGQIPNTGFLSTVVTLDELKRVIVDPLTQMSKTAGIWAAGDCTNGLYHQNNIAAGDAVKALENIYLYIHTK
ncbi:MAG TPA: FAD-dependent oxidoreductase [Candidatus Paceibacterota bacterium]|nr:FAD-dependent oxidoreductase [Candidatus Paceibacterota bacterium]